MAKRNHTEQGFHFWRRLRCLLHTLGLQGWGLLGWLSHWTCNSFSVTNIHNTDATFQKEDSEVRVVWIGWPDLTVANHLAIPNIHNWHVSDTHSGSDHKYIQFNFSSLYTHRSFNTTIGNFRMLNYLIKYNKQALSQQINSITTSEQLNIFTTSLIDTMHTAVRASFILKSVGKSRTFSFWSPELSKQWNLLLFIQRKLKTLRLHGKDSPEIKKL